MFGLLWSDIKYDEFDKPPIRARRDNKEVLGTRTLSFIFCVNPQVPCLPQRNIMIANLKCGV